MVFESLPEEEITEVPDDTNGPHEIIIQQRAEIVQKRLDNAKLRVSYDVLNERTIDLEGLLSKHESDLGEAEARVWVTRPCRGAKPVQTHLDTYDSILTVCLVRGIRVQIVPRVDLMQR